MTACALVKVFRHSDGRGQILPGTLGLGGKRWEGGWDALLIDCDMCRFSWQMSAAFNWSRSNAKIGQDHCSLQGLQNPCVCSVCINEPWLRGIWELVFLSRLGHRACVSSLDHFDCCHGSRRHFWWRRDSLLGCHFVFFIGTLGETPAKTCQGNPSKLSWRLLQRQTFSCFEWLVMLILISWMIRQIYVHLNLVPGSGIIPKVVSLFRCHLFDSVLKFVELRQFGEHVGIDLILGSLANPRLPTK